MGNQLNPPTTFTPGADSIPNTPTQLNSGASIPTREVLVQAAPSNTVSLFVGNASSQPIELVPGAALTFPIDNVNKLYLATSSSTATANWLALF